MPLNCALMNDFALSITMGSVSVMARIIVFFVYEY
jgi:hypothetical protein